MRSPHFLLVGNGPYLNRGCEAIVRGTMAILRNEFGAGISVTLASFGNPVLIQRQAGSETDAAIRHVCLSLPSEPPSPFLRWRQRAARLMGPGVLPPHIPTSDFRVLREPARRACCALEIGGDNYSLDYDGPALFMEMDTLLQAQGVPVILWGASVGPFDTSPESVPGIWSHLKTLRRIHARESFTVEDLTRQGVSANVVAAADPAFAMDATRPPASKLGFEWKPGMIGLNLSPLMARYVTGGRIDAWLAMSAAIVAAVVTRTRRDVLLVPHVTKPADDDHAFLKKVGAACNTAIGQVACMSGDLTAAETKWVISQCAVFVGARTHATIASLSSGVPTLSLAYSRKARGLNMDIFGSCDYCLEPDGLSPNAVAGRVAMMLENEQAIRAFLARAIPPIRELAFAGGGFLRRDIREGAIV